jgi:hypothetical protein
VIEFKDEIKNENYFKGKILFAIAVLQSHYYCHERYYKVNKQTTRNQFIHL